MQVQLIEFELQKRYGVVPREVAEFADAGLRRAKRIDCFDFVPSNCWTLHSILSELPRGTFCEWGSGIGIGVGIASMLGFTAHGIEINEELAAASRALFAEHSLKAEVMTGSYFELSIAADFYFAYCWPGQTLKLEERFLEATPADARLLLCHAADDVRGKVRAAG